MSEDGLISFILICKEEYYSLRRVKLLGAKQLYSKAFTDSSPPVEDGPRGVSRESYM